MVYRRTLIVILSILALAHNARGQYSNGHAQVNALVGTTVTLGLVDETYDTFEDGDEAILMQMQADIAGTNLSNNFAFGNLGNIGSAGRWEIVTILSHTEFTGSPTTITLSGPTSFVYQFGPKSSVQLITFRDTGTPDRTVSTVQTALPWNGAIGGVVALHVSGTMTLGSNITADEAGFRGGSPSVDHTGPCATFTYTSNSSNNGEKGDGLQRVDVVNYRYARGKLINAGGGGNPRNSGGGGGGNITAGGGGGGGYSCIAGGLPGISVAAHVQYDRFFMGGGGGGGQQNNGIGGAGGAGGGIVILKVGALRTVGPCPGLTISVNGADGGSSIGAPPDGAGGGGAGGSVYLYADLFLIDPSCAISCEANGGNGGAVSNSDPWPNNWIDCGGGGGGGGQGLVMCGGGAGGNGGSGWAGMNGGTSSGDGGAHDPAGGRDFDGVGADGTGVAGFGSGPALPVELISFDAAGGINGIDLSWRTATERNSASFLVHRSADLTDWKTIAEIPAAGNSLNVLSYSSLDAFPMEGTNYYRLEQVDLEGTSAFSPMIAVQWTSIGTVNVYPVPANDRITLSGNGTVNVTFIDAAGREVLRRHLASGERTIALDGLHNGPYYLMILGSDSGPIYRSIIIQH